MSESTNTVKHAPDYRHVKEAVEIIKAHLLSEWIAEGCRTDAAFGCTSCQAVRLSADLDALVLWLDDEPSPAPAPQEKMEG